jgi:hypothetical protein
MSTKSKALEPQQSYFTNQRALLVSEIAQVSISASLVTL